MLFSPKGRISREPFWVYSLTLGFPAIVFEWLLYGDKYDPNIDNFYAAYLLITLFPVIMIQVKRWHDRGKSGWWVLLNFVPILGIWALIETGFLAGTEGENEYGPSENSSEDI